MTVRVNQPWEKWDDHRSRLEVSQPDMKDSTRVGVDETYNHKETVGTLGAEHDARPWLPVDSRAQDSIIERPQMIEGSSPSLPASRRKRSSTGALEHRRDLFGNPKPGECPSFHAKVPAELLRSEGSQGRHGMDAMDSDGERRRRRGGGGGEGGFAPALDGVSNAKFESDVRRAMKDLERQLVNENSLGSGERGSPRPLPEGTRSVERVPAFLLPDVNHASRAPSPAQKEERAVLFSSDANAKRSGSGLTDASGATPDAPNSQRQDPELSTVTAGGNVVLGPVRSQRKGPGLRSLWSGPDTASANAARESAKIAYLHALNQDAQLRHAMVNDDGGELGHETRRVSQGPSSPSSRSIGYHPVDARSMQSTLVTGVDSGRKTPRQRAPWEGGEEMGRSNIKAKKAAYAEELRRQIAEKEVRKAKEEDEHFGLRRRVPVGQLGCESVEGPAHGTNGNYHQNRIIEHLSGLPEVTVSTLPVTSRPGESPPQASPETYRHDSHAYAVEPVARSTVNGQLHTVSPTSLQGLGAAERPSSTTARRRLVEDVYGRARVGAALGGVEKHRGSPGSGEGRDASVVEGIKDGDGDGVSVGPTRTFLRTGAGMQSLIESEPEDRLQRRAAALEQQRALREQIAEKAKLKEEEQYRRKLEAEEEARQQREYLRRVEAETEEEKRRRQAKQQEQLEALYQQQEEALRKKRGGSIGNSGVRRSLESSTPHDLSRRVLNSGFDPGQTDSPGSGQPGQGSPAAEEHALGNDATIRTPEHRDNKIKLRFDDLPAGAQARAEILRGVPKSMEGMSPSWEDRTSRRQHGARGLSSEDGGTEASSALARGVREQDMFVNASNENKAASRESRCRGSALRAGEEPVQQDGDRGANETPRRQAILGVPSPQNVEPPLRTHSTLLPLSSGMLFPNDPAATADPAEDVRVHPSRGGASSHAVSTPVVVVRGRPSPHEVRHRSRQAARACGPDNEIDTLATSRNTNSLTGRAVQRSLAHARGNIDAPSSTRSSAQYPKLPISSVRPPRRGVLNARARECHGGNEGDREVHDELLEDSLRSTSRQISARIPPTPPVTTPRSKRRLRRRHSSFAEQGPEASEQSLTSDSVLYFLADSHRERMGEQSTSLAKGGSLPTADTALPTRHRRRWGRENGAALGTAVPPLRSPLAEQEEGHEGDDDVEAMSPLTRLLAQIDVRLGSCKLSASPKDLDPVSSPGDLPHRRKGATSRPRGTTSTMSSASGFDGGVSIPTSKIYEDEVDSKNDRAPSRKLQARTPSRMQLTASHGPRRDPKYGLRHRLSEDTRSGGLEPLKASLASERSASGSSGSGLGSFAGSSKSRASWRSPVASGAMSHALSSKEGGVSLAGDEGYS